MAADARLLIVGKVTGVYGVRGWVRVFSDTAPRERILEYSDWRLNLQGQWRPLEVVEARAHGKGVVVRFAGFDDRDQARALLGAEIAIAREQLPPPAPGEYYWADLEGLQVVTVEGQPLGRVDHLFETGANDVLVVKDQERERLIPFVLEQVVRRVDLPAGVLEVDWDPDF